MNIYHAEASIDGLAEQILEKQSVAYCSDVMPWVDSDREEVQKTKLSLAYRAHAKHQNETIASADDDDLFFTKSILVSTNWNKNDDIFTQDEVWAARHSPSHKRTNLEHNESLLVGHITDTWALDGSGNLIPDNTVIDDLPVFYHLANGAVIYTQWQDEELVARTTELIEQINAGQKFVSMEARFSNFSYAIKTPEQEYHVVARSQDTAFLTKHLRIYGGTGEYDGCSIGRLLRNIVFSGKGYVDKPANPHSVIFKDAPVFNYASASSENPFKTKSGVFISCGTNLNNNMESHQMSENISVDLLKSNNEELKAAVASLTTKLEDVTRSATEAGVKALETKVEALTDQVEAIQAERDEALASVQTLTSDNEAVKAELEEANKAKAELEEAVAASKLAEVRASRISHLVDGGVDKAVAETKVDAFVSLDDTQFESIATDIIALAKFGKKDDKEDSKDKKDDAKADSDIDVDPADAVASTDLEATLTDNEDGISGTVEASTEVDVEKSKVQLRNAIAASLGFETEEDVTAQ